jgi:hypothetical protein
VGRESGSLVSTSGGWSRHAFLAGGPELGRVSAPRGRLLLLPFSVVYRYERNGTARTFTVEPATRVRDAPTARWSARALTAYSRSRSATRFWMSSRSSSTSTSSRTGTKKPSTSVLLAICSSMPRETM